MEPSYQTPFSKSILTALFAGIVATLICLGYNIYYRESTHFPLASIINVSSLIFFVNFLFIVIGVIYYLLIKTMKKGEMVFIILFILLTIFLGWRGTYSHRSDDPLLNHEFHHLLTVMIIVMGLAASVGVPFLFHNKKFEEHVL